MSLFESKWLRWLDERGDNTPLKFARIMFGLFFAWHVHHQWKYYQNHGYFGNHFHLPFFTEAMVPSEGVFLAILVCEALLSAVVLYGRFAQAAIVLWVGLDMWIMFCDRIEFHNNRYALHIYSLALALTPCDRKSAPTEESLNPKIWALRLVQSQLTLIYGCSAGSKLLDAEWRSGQVMAVRLARALPKVPNAVKWVAELLAIPPIPDLLSKGAIATEFFIALGVWHRRTRLLALWVGTMFHVVIEIVASVQLFSYLTLTVLILFTPIKGKKHTVYLSQQSGKHRAMGKVLPWIDWLKHFVIEYDHELATPFSGRIVIKRHDGVLFTGVHAWVRIVANIPLLFVLWGPLALLAKLKPPAQQPAESSTTHENTLA